MMMVFFNYLLEINVCIVALYAFFHFAMQHEKLPLLNRVYLLSALVIAIAIPFINVVIPVSTPEYVNDFSFSEGLIIIVDNNQEIATTHYHTTESTFWNFQNILLSVYLMGVLFFAIRFLRNVLQVFQLIRNNERISFPNYTLILIEKEIPVFSFWNYVFLSKRHFYSEKEKEVILAHEIAHIQEKHTIDVLVMEIVRTLLWFNPIVHLYQRKLREVHEYLADEAVLKGTCTTVQYASLMMQEARKHTPHMLPVTHFFHNQLKNRLIMLSKVKKPARGLKTFLSLPIILLLFIAFSMNGELFGQQKIETPKAEVTAPTPPQPPKAVEATKTQVIAPKPPTAMNTTEKAPKSPVISTEPIAKGTAPKPPQPPVVPKTIEEIPEPPVAPKKTETKQPKTPAKPKVNETTPQPPTILKSKKPKKTSNVLPLDLYNVAQPGECFSRCETQEGTSTKWVQIVCPIDMTIGLMNTINDRLEKRGYKTDDVIHEGSIFYSLGEVSKASLIQFQRANKLPEGQLDMETLKKLNVEIDC